MQLDLIPSNTFHCYRCGQDKAAADFYHHRDGSLVSGCKACHADMARERRAARRAEPAPRAPATPSTPAVSAAIPDVVGNAAPLPQTHYRCEGCAQGAVTVRAEGPRGWKRVRLPNVEGPATLCARCTTTVARAASVMAAVANRRTRGQGHSH